MTSSQFKSTGQDSKLGEQVKLAEQIRGRTLLLCAPQDRRYADIVCAAIETNGAKCWRADRDMPHNLDYFTAVGSAMFVCPFHVLVCSDITASPQGQGGLAEELLALGGFAPHFTFQVIAVPTTAHVNRTEIEDVLKQTPFFTHNRLTWVDVPVSDPEFATKGAQEIRIKLAASAFANLVKLQPSAGEWEMKTKASKPWWKFWA